MDDQDSDVSFTDEMTEKLLKSDCEQKHVEKQNLSMRQNLALLLRYPTLIGLMFVSGIGGGFQFGFNITVMTSSSAFIKELVNKTCAERYGLSLEHQQLMLIWSFLVSIIGLGGFVGSMMVGWLLLNLGRKRCLLLNNLVGITGAMLLLLSRNASSFEMLLVGRFLSGFCADVGYAAQVTYLVECSPKRLRGMVSVTGGTFISIGRLLGQLLGLREALGTEDRWPLLLGFTGLTGLLQLLSLPFFPESPRFLLQQRGDRQACDAALKRLRGSMDYSEELEEMMEEKAAMKNVHNHSVLQLFQNRSMRWQLLTVIMTVLCYQMGGGNSVYFYSSEVFLASGIQKHQLRYVALGTGVCDVLAKLVCFVIIENMGKTQLMQRAYLGISVTLALLTAGLFLQRQVSWLSYCNVVLLFLFSAFTSAGPAALTASFPAEILPEPFKAAGISVGCTVECFNLFLITFIFPIMMDTMGPLSFLLCLVFSVSGWLFMRSNVPEISNRTVLEITDEFDKIHRRDKPGNLI